MSFVRIQSFRYSEQTESSAHDSDPVVEQDNEGQTGEGDTKQGGGGGKKGDQGEEEGERDSGDDDDENQVQKHKSFRDLRKCALQSLLQKPSPLYFALDITSFS